MVYLFFWMACTSSKEDSAATVRLVWKISCRQNHLLLPDVPTTQIHADVVSDGNAIWMVYNLPNADNQFDVYLVSLGCDGTIQQPQNKF